MTSRVQRPFRMFLGILALIILPVGLTLFTVEHPLKATPTSENPTPHGYTWSLLIFVVPVVSLSWRFLTVWAGRLDRRAFIIAAGAFAVTGCLLDMTLGNFFFQFPNKGAVLGIYLPGYKPGGGWTRDLPVEEFLFYVFGNLFTLLVYLWGAHVWFSRYNHESYLSLPDDTRKMFRLHWPSAVYAGVLIVVALAVKKLLVPVEYRAGFPGYLIFEILVLFFPTFLLFYSVKSYINWRAMSLSVILMWLISVIWEVTLGVPYGWWGFNKDMMLGIFIRGWSDLPIEEPILWTLAPWVTAMLYEAVRLFVHSRNSARETLLGARPPAATSVLRGPPDRP